MKHLTWLLLIGVLVTTPPAFAGSPRDVVALAVGGLLVTSADPAQQRPDFTHVAALFDFDEMTRQTVSRHWERRSPAERDALHGLVRDAFERAYLRATGVVARVVPIYSEVVNGDRASVRVRSAGRPDVEYRLLVRDGKWRVYDVLSQGMSFVAFYRDQLDHLFQTVSPSRLLDALKSRRQAAEAPGDDRSRDAAAFLLPVLVDRLSRGR